MTHQDYLLQLKGLAARLQKEQVDLNGFKLKVYLIGLIEILEERAK